MNSGRDALEISESAVPLVVNDKGEITLSSSRDDKVHDAVEIPESAVPLVVNKTEIDQTPQADQIDEANQAEPTDDFCELGNAITERYRRVQDWVHNDAQGADTDIHENERSSFDTGFGSSLLDGESAATGLHSLQHKKLKDCLELMYTDGTLERDDQKHATKGYFRGLSANLGTCLDILHSLNIMFQSGAMPKETTIRNSFTDLCGHLLESEIISLREPCYSAKTLLDEGDMAGLNISVKHLFDKVQDVIGRIKGLLLIEDDISCNY